MRPEELRALAGEELVNRLADLEDELFQLRFQRQSQELEEPLRIRKVRRDIARCKTILRERELAGASQAAEEKA